MSSYTAQLFESLRAASSQPSSHTPDPSRQLGYTFTIPEVDSVTPGAPQSHKQPQLQQPPHRGGAATGAGSYSAAATINASLSSRGPAPSRPPLGGSLGGSGSGNTLPQELEDCYGVIRSQRSQVAQLRERSAILEEQVAEVSRACLFIAAAVGNTTCSPTRSTHYCTSLT